MEATSAIKMQIASIMLDHTAVLVLLDILVTEQFAEVGGYL